MSILIQNGQVIDPASGMNTRADVAIQNGSILSIGKVDASFKPTHTMDATGCIVMPGLVDACARLGETGHEHEGMLETELAAAVAGGVTSVVCPPDTRWQYGLICWYTKLLPVPRGPSSTELKFFSTNGTSRRMQCIFRRLV